MAYFQGSVFSKALRMDTGITVVLPQDGRQQRKIETYICPECYTRKPKILILLHGMSGNHADWILNSSIFRYAMQYNAAVFMPEAQRSFYLNMKYGAAYYDYISKELPEMVSTLFGFDTEDGNLSMAGLSMGGYGALLCSLRDPGRYETVGVFSAGCDIYDSSNGCRYFREREDLDTYKEIRAVFGDPPIIPDDVRPMCLAANILPGSDRQRYFIGCGTEDPLLKDNKMMGGFLQQKGCIVKYKEYPGGHDWNVWDSAIRDYMDYWLAFS